MKTPQGNMNIFNIISYQFSYKSSTFVRKKSKPFYKWSCISKSELEKNYDHYMRKHLADLRLESELEWPVSSLKKKLKWTWCISEDCPADGDSDVLKIEIDHTIE